MCLAGLAAIAAPAISGAPYRPEPVDFEMTPPARVASSSAPGRHVVSRTFEAPKRFNLVGFRWRGGAEPAIAIRTRRSGGRWSRWTPVGAGAEHRPDDGTGEATSGGSDPVWVGEADELQYRMDRVPRGLRLHFVNTKGTATAADRARTALRSAARSAVVAITGRLGVAHAQSGPPPVMTREQWGGEDCRPRSAPRYGAAKAVFVHHTVSSNDYSQADGPAMVLAICRYHRNSNGWDDIGYNFLVDKFGRLYEGRAGGIDQAVVGAHAQGFNSETTSVANIGTHSATPQTGAAIDAMAALIRWKLPAHGQATSGTVELTSGGGSLNRYPSGTRVSFERVSGHRDGGRTACPGDSLYAQLPELRGRVGSSGVKPQRTRLRFSVSPRTIAFTNGTQVSGLLRTMKGERVGGAPVEVQLFVRSAWRTIASLVTRSDGTFEGPVAPTIGSMLRVSYPGGPGYKSTVSSGSRVRVRPDITVKRSVRRAEVGRTPIIEGTIAPPKTRVVVVAQRRVGRRNVTEKRYSVRPRGGRFRKGHRLRRPGLYRFYVRFRGDSRNLRRTSQAVYVRAVEDAGGAEAAPAAVRGFRGYVSVGRGPVRVASQGAGWRLVFRERRSGRVRYRVCVRHLQVRGVRRCWRKRTDPRGRSSVFAALFINDEGGPGRWQADWYIRGGRRVASWRFRVRPEFEG